jgi:multimeric flavodoxin WrbA
MTAACTDQAIAAPERSRVLLINGSEHDERTCRMIRLSKELLEAEGVETDVLDPALHQSTHVYEKWLFAHAVIIIAPAGSSTIAQRFKPAIDRLAGAGYPKHLADLAYGVVVHGEPGDVDDTRSSLTDWLDTLGMVDSDTFATLDRYMGYREPDDDFAYQGDEDYQAEVRNVARAVSTAVADLRAGKLSPPERRLARNRGA